MAVIIKIEREENNKIIRLPDKARIGGKLFIQGFKAQAADEGTLGTSVFMGIWSGCKYKGDILRGIRTGVVTELAICTANGIRNVIKNYRKTKRMEEGDWDG